MATRKSQRVFIWVIAIVMTIGTIAGFVAMMIAPSNEKVDENRKALLTAQYQAEVQAQTDALSKQYYNDFHSYAKQPASFNAKKVKKLTTRDIKVGTGETIDKITSYSAYYIGWNPKGVIFDQSLDGKTLKAPYDPSQGTIEGWSKGVIGMKIGGVREITIPAAEAYGADGSGENIPPNTPIKFIIMAIKKPTVIEPSAELLQYYPQQ